MRDEKLKFVEKLIVDSFTNCISSFTIYHNEETGLITLDDHDDFLQSYKIKVTKE